MKTKFKILLLLLALATGQSSAESLNVDLDCLSEIRRCLENTEPDAERDVCLSSLRGHKACAASSLSRTLEHRFSLSSQSLTAAEDADSFFGAPPFDTACVQNCDRRWLGMTIQGVPADSMRQAIGACLSACEERLPLELLSP